MNVFSKAYRNTQITVAQIAYRDQTILEYKTILVLFFIDIYLALNLQDLPFMC